MSRQKSKKAASNGFSRLLTATVVLAFVFSAGLITGQRLVHHDSLPPLVSVNGPALAAAAMRQLPEDAPPSEKTSFSFYEQLSRPAMAEIRPQAVITAQPRPVPVTAAAAVDTLTPDPRIIVPRGEAHLVETTIALEPAQVAPIKAEVAAKVEPTVTIAAALAVEPKAVVAVVKAAPMPKAEEVPVVIELPTEVVTAVEAETLELGSAPAQPARYTLQVGAYPNFERARTEMDRLKKIGMEPHVIAAEVPGQGKFYRVRVGKFHSMDDARTFQADAKGRNGLDTFVTPL
ncbi:MAG: SPOR domain-containing protein [Bradymonadaceae bacterium]|nr:SPOR domain-containing protein [Lujinxingiaceae bacterium]